MFLRLHFPPSPLSRFVESITYYSGLVSDHSREKLLPDGTVHIVVDLTDTPKKRYQSADGVGVTEFRESWVSGAHDRFIVIGAETGSSMLVIAFRPGGAYPFLGLPLDLLTNSVLPLDCVAGAASARALRQRILDAPDADAKIAVAQAWLAARCGDLVFDPSVDHMTARLHAGGRAGVAGLIDATGYTQRHVSALFRRWVGLSPKQFHRLRRFATLRAFIARGQFDWRSAPRRPDWPDLAVAFGYADQSHMSRDFRDFAGMTPGAFAQTARGIDNYLPVEGSVGG
jgi:AraC-like DNA-binding protein